MAWKFIEKKISGNSQFTRKDISVLIDDGSFDEFYNDFHKYFFQNKLTADAYEYLEKLVDSDENINEEEKNYLKNALSRTFDQADENDIKGLIGEYLLPFYYSKIEVQLVYGYGPKGRSSKEPGIDYVVFLRQENSTHKYKFIVWEIKTTVGTVSGRVSEINRFFNVNGSFDENIDSTINEIQDINKNNPDEELKIFISNLSKYVIKNEECFNIGGCVVSSKDTTSDQTFQSFQNTRLELSKEQRFAKVIIIDKLGELIDALKDNTWNKL